MKHILNNGVALYCWGFTAVVHACYVLTGWARMPICVLWVLNVCLMYTICRLLAVQNGSFVTVLFREASIL